MPALRQLLRHRPIPMNVVTNARSASFPPLPLCAANPLPGWPVYVDRVSLVSVVPHSRLLFLLHVIVSAFMSQHYIIRSLERTSLVRQSTALSCEYGPASNFHPLFIV